MGRLVVAMRGWRCASASWTTACAGPTAASRTAWPRGCSETTTLSPVRLSASPLRACVPSTRRSSRRGRPSGSPGAWTWRRATPPGSSWPCGSPTCSPRRWRRAPFGGGEIKPKCGLVERQGLPPRYTLLQYHKLAEGKITRVSAFDPIKLLGKQPRLVRQALVEMLGEPQNNLRVFAGARAVFDDRSCERAAQAGQSARRFLDGELQAAGLGCTERLLSLLTALLCAEQFTVPERLKRLQAWAAGETAKVAEQLHAGLRARLGASGAAAALSRLEGYELALEGLEAFPCDEAGINVATAQMDALLSRASSEDWGEGAQREVVRWLCRFLLSRIAHDVSVMINFAYVPPEALNAETLERLASFRFKALSSLAAPGPDGDAYRGVWCRATIVDLDPKSPEKIPEYARSLDKYAAAYYRRHAQADAAAATCGAPAGATSGRGGALGAAAARG
ncbi:unnamed protein product, partial [Prorocentrum cordatum]